MYSKFIYKIFFTGVFFIKTNIYIITSKNLNLRKHLHILNLKTRLQYNEPNVKS